MSKTVKKTIYTFSNLPTGGARIVSNLITQAIEKKTKVVKLNVTHHNYNNIFSYIFNAIFVLPKEHKQLVNRIPIRGSILLAHHSWVTKSPYILRYISSQIPSVYICHEPPREFYDNKHINSQTIKEKIINLIRYPIKVIDKRNLRNRNIHIIANSNYSKSVIDNVYNVKSQVVYPGISVNLYSPNKINHKLNQIISVGAINRLKNFEFIIRVVSEIDSRNRPNLIIIGNGGKEKYVKKLLRLAKLHNVNIDIKQNASQDCLIKSYQQSQLFVYAPINEPFGLVVEEAMASMLPIVAYKYGGGYAEIISNRNGKIIDNLNPKLWANEIEDMLANKKSLDKIGKYNQQYICNNFSEENMNNNIWHILKNL